LFGFMTGAGSPDYSSGHPRVIPRTCRGAGLAVALSMLATLETAFAFVLILGPIARIFAAPKR
jgi:hypothetical protein